MCGKSALKFCILIIITRLIVCTREPVKKKSKVADRGLILEADAHYPKQMPQLARTLKIFSLFFIALFTSLSATNAFSQESNTVHTPHVQARILSAQKNIVAGQTLQVGLYFKIIPHWHVYWKNPGDSGESPVFDWKNSTPSLEFQEILWPIPQRIKLGPLANYGYENSVLFISPVQIPESLGDKKNISISLSATWLVCQEECIPESGEFQLSLDVHPHTSEASEHSLLFNETLTQIPQRVESQQSFHQHSQRKFFLELALSELGISPEQYSFEVFPANLGIFEAGFDTLYKIENEILHAEFLLSAQTQEVPSQLDFLLVAQNIHALPDVFGIELSSSDSRKDQVSLSFWLAILGAFLGGLLLNLMPCVLPVLSLKAFSIIKGAANPLRLRKEGLAFTFGVLLSFWTLAGLLLLLRASGEALGWGFQLQNPVFVLSMSLLFIVMSLNFFGVFEMGHSLQSWAGRFSPKKTEGLLSAFLSGILATIIATPCTAPFMGSALGFALTLNAAQSLSIFSVLAIGMALPILLLSWIPALTKFLPKPGAWMESFKQFLGFPMLATALWLLWVYGQQQNLDAVIRALFGALSLAIIFWSTRLKKGIGKYLALILGLALSLGLLWPLFYNASTQDSTTSTQAINSYYGLETAPYSSETLQQARNEGRKIYVDFTAAWCLICQVNKRLVFPDTEVQNYFREKNVLILVADWTDKNASLLVELEKFGRSGVPLNLIYLPQREEAYVLPTVLRPRLVLDALQ
jgi:thiol:disulfide interchange protein/DsbC/DsbD-like thiol-disulfide interchange protein